MNHRCGISRGWMRARASRNCAIFSAASIFAATWRSNRSHDFPGARKPGWRSHCWYGSGPICCCWTSRPITWIWRCATRSRSLCRSTRARSCWYRTTGISCAPAPTACGWWPTARCSPSTAIWTTIATGWESEKRAPSWQSRPARRANSKSATRPRRATCAMRRNGRWRSAWPSSSGAWPNWSASARCSANG